MPKCMSFVCFWFYSYFVYSSCSKSALVYIVTYVFFVLFPCTIHIISSFLSFFFIYLAFFAAISQCLYKLLVGGLVLSFCCSLCSLADSIFNRGSNYKISVFLSNFVYLDLNIVLICFKLAKNLFFEKHLFNQICCFFQHFLALFETFKILHNEWFMHKIWVL